MGARDREKKINIEKKSRKIKWKMPFLLKRKIQMLNSIQIQKSNGNLHNIIFLPNK